MRNAKPTDVGLTAAEKRQLKTEARTLLAPAIGSDGKGVSASTLISAGVDRDMAASYEQRSQRIVNTQDLDRVASDLYDDLIDVLDVSVDDLIADIDRIG